MKHSVRSPISSRASRGGTGGPFAGHLEQTVEEGRVPDARLPLDQHRARLFDLGVEHAFDDADLVVSGKVAAVTIPPEPPEHARAAEPPRRPRSEHDPKWRQAVINIDETHKGSHQSNQVNVVFPASTDVRWYKAPKFQAGQKGVFVLHKTKMKTDEHHELRAMAKAAKGAHDEVEVYTALHPADFQPLTQKAVVKAMIR